jgi:hypothetical protein
VKMPKRRLRNLDVGLGDLVLRLGLGGIYRIHSIAIGSSQRVLRGYYYQHLSTRQW